MSGETLTLDLADEAAMIRLGGDIAAALARGDLVALTGDLGAGKTTLARALIRALAADPDLEVPSPTYTLAQAYAAKMPVTHFDFYRLSDASEVAELGLEEALADGVALVEWPEHGGDALPPAAIAVSLAETADGGRRATLVATGDADTRLRRSLAIRAFLEKAGWGAALRSHLAGDASTRSFELARIAGEPDRIVMDAPEHAGGPPVRDGLPYGAIAHVTTAVTPFVAVSYSLRRQGFAAPEVFAADLEAGILLVEHLGSEGILDAERRPIAARYEAAVGLLAEIHRRRWASTIEAPFGARHDLPPYDRDAMMIEVELLLDWYVPAMTGSTPGETDRRAFVAAWDEVFARVADMEKSLVLRDFHSPNIIWRDDRQGLDRLGLIDLQDALIGPAAYDAAALVHDARATVPAALETALMAHYCSIRAADVGFDEEAFRMAFAIMSAQRCSKILGIFVRLDRRDGKPAYLAHLPRMRDYLRRTIAHEALAPVRALYERWHLLDETPA